ncbi:MAG: hypothetical protein N2746_05885 [Deltaproteobacteria bacterium]|nr:hypothetical protein [Deltaproteobacteria bacterium]
MKKTPLYLIVLLMIFISCKIVYYGHYPSNVEYIYYGRHPIPSYLGGGMCFLNGKHIHNYPPEDIYSFYYYENTYFYIGTSVSYYGPHPIPPGFGSGVCVIHGYHTHNYYPYGSGYVYYPDDNVFVYVDVDINVEGQRPYEPKNRHGEYSSGIPFSDKGGRHEYHPKSDGQGGGSGGARDYSKDASSKSDNSSSSNQSSHSGGSHVKPFLDKPDVNYGPRPHGPSGPHVETPSKTEKRYQFDNSPDITTPKDVNKRIDFEQKPVITTPDDLNKNPKGRATNFDVQSESNRRDEYQHPMINVPKQTEKGINKKENNIPTIDTPSQMNKRFEPTNPTINIPSETSKKYEKNRGPSFNVPSETQKRHNFDTGPKKFDTPSKDRFTPYEPNDNRDKKTIDVPSIEFKNNKDKKSSEEDDEKQIKKVYQKDQIKLPGVNKKIPSPDPASK